MALAALLNNEQEDRPGILLDNVFYSFERVIDQPTIEHERLLTKLRRAEFTLAILFGVLGIGAFVVSVGQVYTRAVFTSSFWLSPNPFLFALAFSFLSLLFAVYRRKRDGEGWNMLPVGKAAQERSTGGAGSTSHADIFAVCDVDARANVRDAFLLALKNTNAEVGPLHLFAGAIGTQPGQILLARLGVTFDNLRDPLRRKLELEVRGAVKFGTRAHAILAEALMMAAASGRQHVSPLEILAACYVADPFFEQLFEDRGINRDELENALAWMRIGQDLALRYKAFRQAASFKPTGNMDRAMTAVATPFLDSVSEDLTRAAVYGRTGLLIGRDSELQTIFRAIEGGQRSVVLVGQPGVGKAAIIDGIADLMVEERVPGILSDKRLLRLSIPHIVSAQGGQGAEERLLYALQEVGHAGNIVLVIENIEELVGNNAGINLASVLFSELEKGYTFVIGTTTPAAYSSAVERSVLGKALSRVEIEEPKRNEAIRILESKVGYLEAKNKVLFTYGALAAAVDLSTRYMHDGVLPAKAIDLTKEVALMVEKRGTRYAWVTKADVAGLVGEVTKIPVTEVTTDEGAKLLKLEEKLHERIIGQEAAVKAVSSSLRRARAELRSESRPIANFLFLGPTGVGKTELAKATAEVFFGNETAMIRFDMSEYQNKESVTRLIGGNNEAGIMTEAVRRNPFSLLLLDELEKAHPDILNLFLQVMDDGRLTDGLGRTIDFTNVILIATSNAGTQYIQDEVIRGTALPAIKDALVNTELRAIYRPEFLNRFNDIIVFSPLTEPDVVAIAYLMIEKVRKQMEAKGITLEVTDGAVHELARQGFDSKFGARPLRRVIEERLENKLADELLKGSFARRDTVIFDVGGKIEVHKPQAL